MIVNMDAAATTPLDSDAATMMIRVAQENFWNPSSHHYGGYDSKAILDNCRHSIAKNVGALASEIYFTSGGTESDNWALESLARWGAHIGKKHIVSTSFEHHAILNKLKRLEKRGFTIDLINPDSNGFIEPKEFERALREDTCFASVMFVNNEIGAVQDIERLSHLCKERNILFHTDAVQAIPHIVLSMSDPRFRSVNMFSVSAHKFGGPRGIGFLYVREHTPLSSMIVGGAQERNKRAGTENLPGIAGLDVALNKRVKSLSDPMNIEKTKELIQYIIKALSSIKGFHLNSDNFYISQDVPIINFYIEGIKGEVLLSLLNSDGIYCSAGSACAAGDPEPSHVLKAMGYDDERAGNSIRLSFDYDLSKDEAGFVVKSIYNNVNFLRGESNG